MEALRALGETLPVPTDFLTTVTSNIFRKQYYFDKKQSVVNAVEVHKKYALDPEEYVRMIRRTLPVMLNSHKILGALFIFDAELDPKLKNDTILEILLNTRPDDVPDFWLTFYESGPALGLKRKSLSQMGRKLVWRYVLKAIELRGRRRVIMQLHKDKKKWNEVFFKAHAHMEGEMEDFVGHILFGREFDLTKAVTEDGSIEVMRYLRDLDNISTKSTGKILTYADLKDSYLPFRILEGYTSSAGLKTDSKVFYDHAIHTMTAYEKLRRTDAMLRSGYSKELWLKEITKSARAYDPVDIASVILQHPELRNDLVSVLNATIASRPGPKFPKDSVVLVDSSRSMKLMLRNARPRCLWELVGLYARAQGIEHIYIFSDTAEPFREVDPTNLGGAFGAYSAKNPTNIAQALEFAKKHNPKWVFIVTDGQDNIPFRGAGKVVADTMTKTKIVTLNPTINPLEPESITGIGSDNEIILPIRDIRQLTNMLKVIT